MLKDIGKYIFMIELGFKYIGIFEKTYFHPFTTLKPAYRKLSKDRQNYSNDVLNFLNIEVEVIGEIPSKDKILYAINHRSLLDILVMENVFSRHNKSGTWIAKQELFDNWLYGKFFRASGCMSVDLNNKKGLLKFFKRMKHTLSKVDDFNVYIFPEGERNKDVCIKEFQSGAQKIAKANQMEMVPVFIDDTLETVFKEAPFEEKKIVKVYVGDIIKDTDLQIAYKELMKKSTMKECVK